MADAKTVLTWEEKLEQGIPLNDLEQTKADATRLTLRRIRDNQEANLGPQSRNEALLPSVQKKTSKPNSSKKGN